MILVSTAPFEKSELFLKATSLAFCGSQLCPCLWDDVTPGTQRSPAPPLLGMTSAMASVRSPVNHQRGMTAYVLLP